MAKTEDLMPELAKDEQTAANPPEPGRPDFQEAVGQLAAEGGKLAWAGRRGHWRETEFRPPDCARFQPQQPGWDHSRQNITALEQNPHASVRH